MRLNSLVMNLKRMKTDFVDESTLKVAVFVTLESPPVDKSAIVYRLRSLYLLVLTNRS